MATSRFRVRITRIHPIFGVFMAYAWHIDYRGEELMFGTASTYRGALFAAGWRVAWIKFKEWVW